MASETSVNRRLRDHSTQIRLIPGLLETVAKHDKSLYGNGDPGMDEILRTILKELAEDRKRREWLFNVTIGAALSTAVMLLINGVVYFAKILPVLEKLMP